MPPKSKSKAKGVGRGRKGKALATGEEAKELHAEIAERAAEKAADSKSSKKAPKKEKTICLGSTREERKIAAQLLLLKPRRIHHRLPRMTQRLLLPHQRRISLPSLLLTCLLFEKSATLLEKKATLLKKTALSPLMLIHPMLQMLPPCLTFKPPRTRTRRRLAKATRGLPRLWRR